MVLGGAALLGVGFRLSGGETDSEGEYEGEPSGRVVALGRIMPADGFISIPLAPTARVQSLSVEEGGKVQKDDVLAVLHSTRALQAEVELAQSMIDEAARKWNVDLKLASAQLAKNQSAIDRIKGSTPTEDRAMEDSVAALDLAVQQQQKDLDRLSKLSRDVVPEQQLEHQRLLLKKAVAEHKASVSANELNREQRKFRLAVAEEDFKVAHASHEFVEQSRDFQALRIRLMQAKERLDDATIRAPVSGTILRIFVRAGEAGGQKPLLQMANLDELEVVAEVFQTDVPRIKIGGSARVRSDAWGERELEGKVGEADTMVSTPAMRSLDPLSPADRHVVRVPVALSPASRELAARWLQMQVDVILPVKP